MRHREVDIHHADLDAGYGPADWPEDFLDEMFDRVVRDRDGRARRRCCARPTATYRWPAGTDPWSPAAGST